MRLFSTIDMTFFSIIRTGCTLAELSIWQGLLAYFASRLSRYAKSSLKVRNRRQFKNTTNQTKPRNHLAYHKTSSAFCWLVLGDFRFIKRPLAAKTYINKYLFINTHINTHKYAHETEYLRWICYSFTFFHRLGKINTANGSHKSRCLSDHIYSFLLLNFFLIKYIPEYSTRVQCISTVGL